LPARSPALPGQQTFGAQSSEMALRVVCSYREYLGMLYYVYITTHTTMVWNQLPTRAIDSASSFKTALKMGFKEPVFKSPNPAGFFGFIGFWVLCFTGLKCVFLWKMLDAVR